MQNGNKQNRDNLPVSLTEEKRFFELLGSGKRKTDVPASWNNPDNWKTLDDIPENKHFGFVVGTRSNYLLIDGDHILNEQGDFVNADVKSAWERISGAAVTYWEKSLSGTGIHLLADLGDYSECFDSVSNGINDIILWMDPKEYAALSREEKDRTPKIEMFFHVNGRYVYLTGDNTGAVEVARDEDAASIFRECLQIRDENKRKYNHAANGSGADPVRPEMDEETKQRILEVLPFISAADYETWIHVGMALCNEGFPFEVWDEWSRYTDQRTGEAYYNYNSAETAYKWKSFQSGRNRWNRGTIFRLANLANDTSQENYEGLFDEASCFSLPGLSWIDFNQIQQKEISWLVPGYIPRKAITVLGGDGGVGKTSIECAIAAAISAGRQTFLTAGVIPEEIEEIRPGKVVLLNAEDPYGEVLKPLLEAYGANQDNILSIDETQIKESGLCYSDKRLRADMRRFKPDLIIFDPIQQFIPDRVNMSERNKMRREITSVMAIAVEIECAILLVMHTNKQRAVWGRQRLADTADIWDVARSVLMAGIDEEDQDRTRHLSHEKSNFGNLQSSITFNFDEARRIQIIERNDKRDRDYIQAALSCRGTGATAAGEAEDYIIDMLSDGEEMIVSSLERNLKNIGISGRAIRDAKKSLKEKGLIKYRKESKGKNNGVLWFISLKIPVVNMETPPI